MWGGIRAQEGDGRVGLESSIQLPDVELPDLHEAKGPDPLKCTIENVLMINQGKNFLSIVQPVFPRKDMSNVSYLCRRVRTCLFWNRLSDCWCIAMLIDWNLNGNTSVNLFVFQHTEIMKWICSKLESNSCRNR